MLKGERLSLHESTMGRFQGISCAYLNPSDKLITVYEGFADKESRIPVDENTIFPACSISKFITALCVMKTNEKEIVKEAEKNHYVKVKSGQHIILEVKKSVYNNTHVYQMLLTGLVIQRLNISH